MMWRKLLNEFVMVVLGVISAHNDCLIIFTISTTQLNTKGDFNFRDSAPFGCKNDIFTYNNLVLNYLAAFLAAAFIQGFVFKCSFAVTYSPAIKKTFINETITQNTYSTRSYNLIINDSN